jgi:hypothetical protein
VSVETPEYLGMLSRMIRAAGKRVAESDEPELAQLLGLRDELDKAVEAAVAGQRELGKSWAMIALATGTTRQGAQQRWGKREDEELSA